jgi:hypothetical protein
MKSYSHRGPSLTFVTPFASMTTLRRGKNSKIQVVYPIAFTFVGYL